MPGDGCGSRAAAVLFQGAELAVDGSRVGLVADPLEDVQGALVLAGGLVVVPAGLGDRQSGLP